MRAVVAAALLAALAGAGVDRCGAAGAGADAVLERWITSIGGRDALGNVRSEEVRESMDYGPGGPPSAIHFIRTKFGHIREETSNPAFGTLVQAWDGMIGWQRNDRLGTGLIPQADLARLVQGDNIQAPLNVGKTYRRSRLLGPAGAGGRPCTEVGMTDGGGVEERWFFDDATGRLVRIERPDPGRPGTCAAAEFSDYRPVGRLMIAYRIRTTNQGASTVLSRESVVINPPVDEAVFMISTARLAEVSEISSILARNVAQAGGDAIGRIHSRVKRIAVVAPESGIRVSETIYQKEPNLFLQELETPGVGTKWEGFDGVVRWSDSDLQGFHTLGAAATAQWKAYGSLSDEGRLLARLPLGRMLGARKIGGRPVHAVVLSDFFAEAGTWYFDDESARVLRLTTVFSDGHGRLEATQDYSDFRRVDGVEIPFATTDTNAAGESIETIVSLQNNVPLDDKFFKPRKGPW